MNAEPLRENLLDQEGFLNEDTGWSQDVARELAERNDLGPITKDQWRIIYFVRDYYKEFGEGPPIMKIAKATGLTSKQICSCFPCGVAKGAYRLAGLPKPSGCL
ncbi:MAG: TusE/DsrC/DsvC family sulfur relay protein [Candidatus Latescibacterota bacterium]|nr:MAG: TusE/DsrC/DsvC family sulfur relay protein [Candidatus Latescibacterota bacterium]